MFHVLAPEPREAAGEDLAGARSLTRVESIHPAGGTNHLHGLGYDAERDQLLLATHQGLFVLDRAAEAADDLYRLDEPRHDFMGFQAHPRNADLLYASGHPASGGNLGFLRSFDAGQTWTRVSNGAGSETVDFHAMAVSPRDTELIAGWFGGALYVSEDGGASWQTQSGVPGGACWGAPCLAFDATARESLWRATTDALLVSPDLGRSWSLWANGTYAGVHAHPADGSLWVWDLTQGGQRYEDPMNGTSAPRPVELELVGGAYVFQWSGHPTRADVVFAASVDAQGQAGVHRTLDGGATWTRVIR